MDVSEGCQFNCNCRAEGLSREETEYKGPQRESRTSEQGSDRIALALRKLLMGGRQRLLEHREKMECWDHLESWPPAALPC